jgi:hypothetical protein
MDIHGERPRIAGFFGMFISMDQYGTNMLLTPELHRKMGKMVQESLLGCEPGGCTTHENDEHL